MYGENEGEKEGCMFMGLSAQEDRKMRGGMEGRTDGWMDGWMDGGRNGWMVGWMDAYLAVWRSSDTQVTIVGFLHDWI